ncbi:hypothetical protein AgCh_029109 [Apium graveolens]
MKLAEIQTVMPGWEKEFKIEMDTLLAHFREEYLTIIGSNARCLSPQKVYDAINKVTKAQIKAFHNFGKALTVTLTVHQDKIMGMVMRKMDETIPSQVVQDHITNFNDTRRKLDQMHTARYTPSLLVFDEIQKHVQAAFGPSTSASTSTSQPASTSTNLQIQALEGAIMGKLNIPLSTLPQSVRPELPTPLPMPVSKTKGEIEVRIQQSKDVDRLLKAAEGCCQDQEFNELLPVLRVSLHNKYITYKKALANNINFVRVVIVKVDNFLEKRIIANVNDCGLDMCLQGISCISEEESSRISLGMCSPLREEKNGHITTKKQSKPGNFPVGSCAPAQQC